MLFGKKNKEGNRSVNLTYVDGIDGYTKGAMVEVSINNEKESLLIKSRFLKLADINLKLEQLTGVEVATEKQIEEKSKSVVGRAIIGTVLLPGLGTIVGGMTGIGNKKNVTNKHFIILNYKSKTGETKILTLEIVQASLHWASFVTDLRKKIAITEIETEKEIYL